MSIGDNDNPLRPLVSQWKAVLKLAAESKKRLFGDDAEEAMNFFRGDHAFLWDSKDSRSLMAQGSLEGAPPEFRITYNVVAELVQLFGPTMYHRNPHRQVNPREELELPEEVFVDPMLKFQAQQLQGQLQDLSQQIQQPGNERNPQIQFVMLQARQQLQQISQQIQRQQQQHQMLTMKSHARFVRDKMRAGLLERYLNYTPNELDLKNHARDTIDEALIKGCGTLWTELYKPPQSDIYLVGSFYDSINNLLLDPDAETFGEVQWAARRCILPTWEWERQYNLPRGSVIGSVESKNHQGSTFQETYRGEADRRRGDTNDLAAGWKIYSKMGMGTRLKTAGEQKNPNDTFNKAIAPLLDEFGDYCHLCITDHNTYPLNLPPKSLDKSVDDLAFDVQWPIPFWADDDWPFTKLEFHRVPNHLWPMSHVRPAMGEIRFLNFCMSFLAGKMRTACQDIIAVMKSAGDEIKKSLTSKTVNGFTYVEIETSAGPKSIQEVITFLQMPPFHGDIWKVIAAVAEKCDKRLGLTELAYGQSARQFRSAAEAETKQQNFSVRPDDMANTVEDFMTRIARKEALACRDMLRGEDVKPILGEEGAMLWDQLVFDNANISDLMREFTYRIEANSAKKPNLDRDMGNVQQAMQAMLPILNEFFQMTRDPTPLNALFSMWAEASLMPHDKIKGLMIPQLPPQPNPEEQKMQMQMELEKQKAQLDMQVKQQDMQFKAQAHQMDLQAKQQELAVKQQENQMDLQQQSQQSAMEMQTTKATTMMDLMMGSAKMNQQIQMGEQKLKMAKKQAAMKPKPAANKK